MQFPSQYNRQQSELFDSETDRLTKNCTALLICLHQNGLTIGLGKGKN